MNPSPFFRHFALQAVYASACNDAAFSVRLLQLFLSATPATMQELERALREDDLVQWRNASHTIRGNALLIGARRLGELAAELEQAGTLGAMGSAAGTAAELRDEYAHVIREVAQCAGCGAEMFQPLAAAG